METKNESNSKKDEIILAVQTKDKAVQFKGEDLKFKRKNTGQKIQTNMETNKRMLQRDREEKKTSMAIAEYIARAEFNPRRNNHYVNNRTGN